MLHSRHTTFPSMCLHWTWLIRPSSEYNMYYTRQLSLLPLLYNREMCLDVSPLPVSLSVSWRENHDHIVCTWYYEFSYELFLCASLRFLFCIFWHILDKACLTVACPASLQCQLPCHFTLIYLLAHCSKYMGQLILIGERKKTTLRLIEKTCTFLKIHLDLMASLGVRVRGRELGHALVCLCSLWILH